MMSIFDDLFKKICKTNSEGSKKKQIEKKNTPHSLPKFFFEQ